MKTRVSKWMMSMSVLGGLMLVSQPAYAYIDPGSVNMLFQALIAAIAAGSVFIGIFWRKIKIFFSRLMGKKQSETDQNVDQQ